MIIIFAITALACLFLRVFYYERSQNESVTSSLTTLLGLVFSIKYMLPLKIQKGEKAKITEYKKRANLFLLLFYIVFAVTLIYAGIYASFHNGRVS